MTVGDYLDALAALPFGTLDDIVGREPFLVLSPHPDDETLGCGGLLARAESADVRGHVLVLTDGAASHPNSASYPADRLIALRRDEARAAAARLGVALWAYPVWGLHRPREAALDEPPPRGVRLDIAAERARKRRAIDRYPSQMTRLIDDDPGAFCFTVDQLAPFLGAVETFIAVAP